MNDRKQPPASESLREEFAGRLRSRREELGLSQPGLGKRLRTATGKAVSGTQVSRWERAVEYPSRFYRPQLADALEADEESLFGVLAAKDDGIMAAKIDALNNRIEALAAILGVTEEELDRAVQRRRRVRRTTSAAVDGDELPPSTLIPDRDLGDDEDSTEPPASLGPRRSGTSRKPRKG